MANSKNVTNLNLVKNTKKKHSKVSALSPREIVSELDRYVIGQKEAKKAVAVALRNRWRRQALSDEMRDEVLPKNILMIGPTGVGKTSSFISSDKACLLHLFLKATATAFFASFWPITYLSSSDTISLGDKALTFEFSFTLFFTIFKFAILFDLTI